jgi:DNA invertase Pin-like site-specific DNA recombinase
MPSKGEHPNKGWAATYGRYSFAQTRWVQESPEIHDRINRRTAVLRGFKVKPGCEFYDKGITGSKNVRLPELERAIKAVVDREVEALVVPALDRLSRRGMRHVGKVLDAVESAGGRIIFAKEGLDTGQQASRAIIAFLAEQARAEAQAISWRIGQWHEGRRIKGMWAAKRPYGYRVVNGRLVPHPDEAQIVRRMVAEFLNGKSPRLIARDLNADGVLSPGAAKAAEMQAEGRASRTRLDASWGATAVRSVLINPALCGWRQHNRKVVLGPDGEPVSFGDAILAPGDRARILAEFERRTTIIYGTRNFGRIGGKTGSGRPARYLLTGITVCDSCNYAMTGYLSHGAAYISYRCSSIAHGYGCSARAHIRADPADAEVKRQLTARLAAMKPDDPVLGAIAERWRKFAVPEGEGERVALEGQRDAIRARIVDLEEARYVRGEFDSIEEVTRWDGMMNRLRAQRDAVLAALDQLGPPADFDLAVLLDTYQSREAWDEAPLAHRRELLKIAVDKVKITPAHGNRSIPIADRIRLVLAGEDDDRVR